MSCVVEAAGNRHILAGGTRVAMTALSSMRNLPFDSVTVLTKQNGHLCNITSVEQAANFLAHEWPTRSGPAYTAARIACLDAMEFALSASEARNAFVEAAKEASIYVGEGWWREF